MDKAGKKTRDIAYHSAKNGGMVTVHSEAARAYSKYLEERSDVMSYEACKPLDINRLGALQKTDIRGEYFREQWRPGTARLPRAFPRAAPACRPACAGCAE